MVKYDFCSSGIGFFKFNLNMGKVDLGVNYAHGNPEAASLLAKRYNVQPENVFVSSEGTSGQNARIIRYLAERNPKKNEAIVEYPTYEPLLRQVQEHFRNVNRLDRLEKHAYRLDVDALRKVVSEKTGLLVLTNPHAPSGAVSEADELREVMAFARERGLYVLCDEIYAEFDRGSVPTLFSVDPEYGIVTTSFTKAYGLGGLKLGIALASKQIVDELYTDVLSTVGNSSNITQIVAAELLSKAWESLEKHKQRWNRLRNETEKLLRERGFRFLPNKMGVTYWVRLPTLDTYELMNLHAIPRYSVAAVPGTFFLFKSGCERKRSSMIRLSLGNIDPDGPNLVEGLGALEKALNTHGGRRPAQERNQDCRYGFRVHRC
jgi:aspartate/methionine/tyrosine aminotransferase